MIAPLFFVVVLIVLLCSCREENDVARAVHALLVFFCFSFAGLLLLPLVCVVLLPLLPARHVFSPPAVVCKVPFVTRRVLLRLLLLLFPSVVPLLAADYRFLFLSMLPLFDTVTFVLLLSTNGGGCCCFSVRRSKASP